MKDKTCWTDALELFNKGTVIPRSERIHVLRADKGTEFTSAAYLQYCLDIGIQLKLAWPKTPQEIEANERSGRTIMNIVRCMLADSTLPSILWGELIHRAVYLSNRTPHAALHNGTPYKALYGKDAHLRHLRVVGARACVLEETHNKKLESRAWEGLLVGYSLDSKSNRLYNAQTRWVREGRNVIFIETTPAPPSLDGRGFDDAEFTYTDQNDMIRDLRNYTTNNSVDALSANHAVGDPSVLKLLEVIFAVRNLDLGLSSADPSPAAEDAPADDSLASPGGVSPPESGNGAPSPAASPSGPVPARSSSGPASPPRTSGTGSAPVGAASRGRSACGRGSSRSGRDTRGGSSRGASALGGIATSGGRGSVSGRGSRGGRGSMSAPLDTRITRAISGVPNYKTRSELRRLSYSFPAMGEFADVEHMDAILRLKNYAYAVVAVQPDVPRTIQEARASPDAAKWNAAAEREMKSLNDRKVYKLVSRSAVPPRRNRIKSKWVFKRKADGFLKGRVVAQGWDQVPGLDCGSTYAPVCRIQSVRMLACIFVGFNLIFDQMDVSTAFLYADIQEQVLVEQPPGFEVKDRDGGDMVMQVEKSLYGFAQNPGNWFNTIDPVLVEIGFVALKSDPCVYLYDHNGAKTYLTLTPFRWRNGSCKSASK